MNPVTAYVSPASTDMPRLPRRKESCLPTVIHFNRPGRDDITSPSASELWVMTRVREALASQFVVSPVGEDPAWSHHEDEELGIPPLGTMAFISISSPPLWIQLETQYWHAPAADNLRMQVYVLETGTEGRRARAVGPDTAKLWSSLGLTVSGARWSTAWTIESEQDHSVVAAIVRMVQALAATPVATS